MRSIISWILIFLTVTLVASCESAPATADPKPPATKSAPKPDLAAICAKACPKWISCNISFEDPKSLGCPKACQQMIRDTPENLATFDCSGTAKSCDDVTDCLLGDRGPPPDLSVLAKTPGRCDEICAMLTSCKQSYEGGVPGCKSDCRPSSDRNRLFTCYEGALSRAKTPPNTCKADLALIRGCDNAPAPARGPTTCSASNMSKYHMSCNSNADCCPSSSYSTFCGAGHICQHPN